MAVLALIVLIRIRGFRLLILEFCIIRIIMQLFGFEFRFIVLGVFMGVWIEGWG